MYILLYGQILWLQLRVGNSPNEDCCFYIYLHKYSDIDPSGPNSALIRVRQCGFGAGFLTRDATANAENHRQR